MRTSIILDDELGRRLRAAAKQKGQSLSAFLADAGRVALRAEACEEAESFELITFGTSGVRSGVNLDKTSELIAAEDEARYGESMKGADEAL